MFVTLAFQQTLPYNKTRKIVDLYKFNLTDGVRRGELLFNMERTSSALFVELLFEFLT